MVNNSTANEIVQRAQDLLKPLEEALEDVNETLYDKIKENVERIEDYLKSPLNPQDISKVENIIDRLQKQINKIQKQSDLDLEPFEEAIEELEDFFESLDNSPGNSQVEITINGDVYQVKRGPLTATEIKNIAGEPQAYLVDLIDDGARTEIKDKIVIKGGEVFIVYPQSGAAS